MARIAIPNWDGRVSPVFDAARELIIEDTAEPDGERSVASIATSLIPEKVRRIEELGIDVVLCGGISNTFRAMIEEAGIRVIPWLTGGVEEVLQAYRAGSLGGGGFAMPGRRARRGRRHRAGRANDSIW